MNLSFARRRCLPRRITDGGLERRDEPFAHPALFTGREFRQGD
jgi:hypothetical protein